MVDGLFQALPGDRALLSPSSARDAKHRRQLDASVGATGPHGFAVRGRRIRLMLRHVHRIPPHARDDRETPLLPGRDHLALLLFLPDRQVQFGKSEIGGAFLPSKST